MGKDFRKHVKNHTGLYVAMGGDRMGCNCMAQMGQVNPGTPDSMGVGWARYMKGNPDIYPPFKGAASRCVLGSRCFWVCMVESGNEPF